LSYGERAITFDLVEQVKGDRIYNPHPLLFGGEMNEF
jgi:hypothetical protein